MAEQPSPKMEMASRQLAMKKSAGCTFSSSSLVVFDKIVKKAIASLVIREFTSCLSKVFAYR